MKNHTATRKALQTLTAAVLTTAAAFGLGRAAVFTEGAGYYVLFESPSGYLIRTETADNSQAALFGFEKALFHTVLYNH